MEYVSYGRTHNGGGIYNQSKGSGTSLASSNPGGRNRRQGSEAMNRLDIVNILIVSGPAINCGNRKDPAKSLIDVVIWKMLSKR